MYWVWGPKEGWRHDQVLQTGAQEKDEVLDAASSARLALSGAWVMHYKLWNINIDISGLFNLEF